MYYNNWHRACRRKQCVANTALLGYWTKTTVFPRYLLLATVAAYFGVFRLQSWYTMHSQDLPHALELCCVQIWDARGVCHPSKCGHSSLSFTGADSARFYQGSKLVAIWVLQRPMACSGQLQDSSSLHMFVKFFVLNPFSIFDAIQYDAAVRTLIKSHVFLYNLYYSLQFLRHLLLSSRVILVRSIRACSAKTPAPDNLFLTGEAVICQNVRRSCIS